MARLSLKTKTVTNDLVVNIGTSVNDKTGDPLRTAFGKLKDSINQAEANFIELYSAVGADVAIPTQTNNEGKFLTTNGTTLSWATVSSGTTLPASTSGYLKNNGSGTLTWEAITIPTTLGDLGITAGANGQFLQTDGAGSYTWADINITGAVVVAVPLHSYGVAGDTAGMIAFDMGYFYWCFQNYVDDSTDCWKRVNAFAGSW
jgi:hypothetical protein